MPLSHVLVSDVPQIQFVITMIYIYRHSQLLTEMLLTICSGMFIQQRNSRTMHFSEHISVALSCTCVCMYIYLRMCVCSCVCVHVYFNLSLFQTIGEIQHLVQVKLDAASLKILCDASSLQDPETSNLQYTIRNADIVLCVWGNLSKNPRLK